MWAAAANGAASGGRRAAWRWQRAAGGGFLDVPGALPCPRLVRGMMTEFPEARPTMPYFGEDVMRDREVTARLRRFRQLSEVSGSSMLERETHLAGALVLLVGRHATNPKGPRPPGREPAAVR